MLELVKPELKARQPDHFRPRFKRFVLRKAPVENTNGQRNASSGSVSPQPREAFWHGLAHCFGFPTHHFTASVQPHDSHQSANGIRRAVFKFRPPLKLHSPLSCKIDNRAATEERFTTTQQKILPRELVETKLGLKVK